MKSKSLPLNTVNAKKAIEQKTRKMLAFANKVGDLLKHFLKQRRPL